MACDAGQDIDPGRVVDGGEVKVAGIKAEAAGGGKSEGGLTQFDRINAQKQVVHDRIADEDQLVNPFGIDAGLGADRLDQTVDGRADGGGHFLVAAGVHHRIGDAAHQVFAKADLGVHDAGRGQNGAIGQIAQMGRDGGGAEVDGEAEEFALMIAGPDVENAVAGVVVALVQSDGHFPAALAQSRLQAPHQAEFGGDAFDVPLLFQRARKAFEIAGRLVHVGLVNLDV